MLGPTATPPDRAVKNSEPGNARILSLEATIVLETQLRWSRALLGAAPTLCRASEPWSLLINHLVKTAPVQVGFDP